MKSFTAVKLRFLSPLHVGEPGVGVEKVLSYCIHSDTLWAAILHGWCRLGYDPSVLTPYEVRKDHWEPSFRLSSAFPWVGDILYFPKPVGPMPLREEVEPHLWKKLKKVRFLPQKVFERWIKGEGLDRQAVAETLSFWQQLESRVSQYAEPHVRLGYASFAPQIYYLGVSSFQEGAGLYFLLEGLNEELKDPLFSTLNFLAEEGIGGKRSRGFGLFEWEPVTLSLDLPEVTDGWLLLSTIIPEEALLERLSRSTFQLYQNRGWAMSSTGDQAFRKPVWMILEGATFPIQPRGRVVDVTPEDWPAPHKVWRHGIALTIPFKRGRGND